ncbi:cytochrome c5 family protein [Marinobacter sp.]|uniref:c-type cytochrome n=1 Tax=Marinobacter sp. TaxID=50741 RepID=UPI003562252E
MFSKFFSKQCLSALFALATACATSACTDTSQPSQTIVNYAQSAVPDDAQVAEVYQRSCMACHSRGASDAPLTGHSAAWQPRLAQGMETLVNNVVSGKGGMPPYGLCMDCNASEFQTLITFMATPAKP